MEVRTECMNCENEILEEGDAFCPTCEPYYMLTDDGDVVDY